MGRPPAKAPEAPLVVRGPQPGDHLIRFVEPVVVRSGKARGNPKEWSIHFRMQDGSMLYVGLRTDADLVRLADLCANAVERSKLRLVASEASEAWNPEDDLP
jgi:hypothetical protein